MTDKKLDSEKLDSAGRRIREAAFQKARLPSDFSAHGNLNSDDTPSRHHFFQYQSDMLKVLARGEGFDLTKLVVEFSQTEQLTKQERAQLSHLFNQVANRTLRKTDCMFDIKQQGAAITIMLPGTSKDKARLVIRKLEHALQQLHHPLLQQCTICFTTETLHEMEKALV